MGEGIWYARAVNFARDCQAIRAFSYMNTGTISISDFLLLHRVTNLKTIEL